MRTALVFIVRSELIVLKDFRWPRNCFLWSGLRFNETGEGDWTGFYDWLRNENGRLLGIRYWPSSGVGSIAERVKQRSYLDLDEGCVKLWFVRGEVSEPQSADQAFQYAAVFSNERNEYALAFDDDELEPGEVRELEEKGLIQGVADLCL